MTYGRKVATYASNDVRTANRLQLLIMLYDSAVKFMTLAGQKMAEGDLAGKGENIGKAMAIISEFKGTLDHSAAPELAQNLERLYTFINDCLVRANIDGDPAKLDEALLVTKTLREGWVELSKNVDGGNPDLSKTVREVNQDSCLRISV